MLEIIFSLSSKFFSENSSSFRIITYIFNKILKSERLILNGFKNFLRLKKYRDRLKPESFNLYAICQIFRMMYLCKQFKVLNYFITELAFLQKVSPPKRMQQQQIPTRMRT